MPSRIFTYNPNSPLPGYNQIDDLIIGEIGQNPSNLAPYKWFMGPQEEGRYIFAKSISSRNIPTPDGLNDGNVTFYSSEQTDEDFLKVSSYIRKLETGIDENFLNVSLAIEWLNSNGYWSNKEEIYIPWTPAQIPTANWYDAADEATFTKPSNVISQWNDKSGNNRHMVQSNASFRPSYVSNQLNGLAIVDFLASNRFLDAVVPTRTQGSYYLVAKAISPLIGQAPISFNGASPRGSGILFQQNFGIQPFNTPRPTWVPWGIIGYIEPASLPSANNKVGTYNGNTSPGVLQLDTNTNYFLSPLALGYRQVGGLFMNCQIAEVVICDEIHNATTRQLMEGYLAWKWGLQNNLPVGHPYKNNPPTV